MAGRAGRGGGAVTDYLSVPPPDQEARERYDARRDAVNARIAALHQPARQFVRDYRLSIELVGRCRSTGSSLAAVEAFVSRVEDLTVQLWAVWEQTPAKSCGHISEGSGA